LENEEMRLETIKDLRMINAGIDETCAEKEKISKEKIPETSSEIVNSELRIRESQKLGSFEFESRQLASLLTSKNDLDEEMR